MLVKFVSTETDGLLDIKCLIIISSVFLALFGVHQHRSFKACSQNESVLIMWSQKLYLGQICKNLTKKENGSTSVFSKCLKLVCRSVHKF